MLERTEIIGKTFKDLINELDPNTELAIGSKDGTGYFYFGKAVDAIETVRKIQNKIADKYDKKVEAYEERLAIIKDEYERCARRLDNSDFKNPVLMEKKDSLKHHMDCLNATIGKALDAKDLQENVPIEDRIVIDIYNKVEDANVGVILDAYLKPSYWFKDEYERKQAFVHDRDWTIENLYIRYPELTGKYDLF